MQEAFERALTEGAALLASCVENEPFLQALDHAGMLVATVLRDGGKVLVCGNGGSLCDAAHFAEEFTGRFRNNRRPLPVLALSDPAHMSCVANDFGFEFVFARMVEAFCRPGDLLVLLSTSGNSPNLVRAAESAEAVGVKTVGFLGRGGGALLRRCDVAVVAPGDTSDRIQEIHMLVLHALIEAVEAELGVA